MDSLATLSLLQEHFLEGIAPLRDPVRIGGFVALFHPDDAIFYANPACPVEEVSSEDALSLVREYEARGRVPWLEFSLELWPKVPAALEAAGLELKHRIPLMVLSCEEWKRSPSTARRPGSEEIAEFRRVGNEAFGVTEADTEARIERTRAGIESGRILGAMVENEGRIVSVGQAVGTTSIREVVGLATLPDFRKRGYCSQVISALLTEHFDGGGELAWLTPIDETAGRVYQRAGFHAIGTQVIYGPPSVGV